MPPSRSQLATAALVGLGATAVMDVGGDVWRRARGTRPLDPALVGRWVGHMARGRMTHRSIRDTPPIWEERVIGWVAHYAIGAACAVGLVAARPGWLERPTLTPALATGLATTAAPWLVMQPAFGMGVAASRTPRPGAARWASLRAHAVYGTGLWVAGRAARAVRG